jgi:uncharacterized protein (TIGR02757 family)
MDEALKRILDDLVEIDSNIFLNTDPLELVREYERPEDAEIAAFIAAAFALGRTGPMREAIQRVLDPMGASPHEFILRYHPSRCEALYQGFVYRFIGEKDLHLLLWWLNQIVKREGCLEGFFMKHVEERTPDIGLSLSSFVHAILALPTAPVLDTLPPKGSGVRHFLADPADGSGCKRLNLFLRWVVRRGSPDLGIWRAVDPSRLIIPLDTHVARLGRRLGLTKRTSPGWAMAEEITMRLRRLDASDPVKYDFALCHVGMRHPCPSTPGLKSCVTCPVVSLCESARKESPA